jgi:hypothetical protein
MRGRAVAARRAHNPEVSGSNPLPATIFQTTIPLHAPFRGHKDRGNGRFWFRGHYFPSRGDIESTFRYLE